MTVQKTAISVHRYTGLSGDTKPTSVPAGSTYLATDTQAIYITYDGTNWVLKDPFGEVQTSPTSNTLLRRLKDLLTGVVLAAGTNVIGKTQDSFGGAVYRNSDTATADTARRFETVAKKLRDVVIQVATQDQLFGNSSTQDYLVAAGSSFKLSKVDVSTLYFKNSGAGLNGTVRILGVEE